MPLRAFLGLVLCTACTNDHTEDSFPAIVPEEGYWSINDVHVISMNCSADSDEEPYSMMKDIDDFALTVYENIMNWRFPNNYQIDCPLTNDTFTCNTVTGLADTSFTLTWDFSGSISSPEQMQLHGSIHIDCTGEEIQTCRSNFPLYPCTWLEEGNLTLLR